VKSYYGISKRIICVQRSREEAEAEKNAYDEELAAERKVLEDEIASLQLELGVNIAEVTTRLQGERRELADSLRRLHCAM
jgi:hypothetical protein